MAYEVLMPQLGLTMEEGTVSSWVKHEGDAVKAGDVLLEITTDKLTNEVTSEHDGVLLKIVAQEGADAEHVRARSPAPVSVGEAAARECALELLRFLARRGAPLVDEPPVDPGDDGHILRPLHPPYGL